MRKSEIAQLVEMLMAAYPLVTIGDKTSEVYEALLADLDVEPANRAVHELIAANRFFPTIAEIRTAAGSPGPTNQHAHMTFEELEAQSAREVEETFRRAREGT